MPRIELCLPDLGLDGQSISLSGWLVSRGTRVEAGEPVAEVLAGPATVELPAPAAGVLVRRWLMSTSPFPWGKCWR